MRKPVKPTRRQDFIVLILQNYTHTTGHTKTDIREMSLKSLKQLWKKIKHDNMMRIMRGR